MTAGVVLLLGLLAMWIGITGRGNKMWIALTGSIQPKPPTPPPVGPMS